MPLTKKDIIFDLDTKVVDQILSKSNRQKAYSDIQKFMETAGFIHIEGSSYSSKKPLQYYKIQPLLRDLVEQYPYLDKCVRDIRCTKQVGQYNYTSFFCFWETASPFLTCLI